MVFHTYSPSEINAIQRVNTCSTFYIWHMWNCITLNFVTIIFIDIQDNVIDGQVINACWTRQSDLITKFSWHAFCPVNYHNYKLYHKTGQN